MRRTSNKLAWVPLACIGIMALLVSGVGPFLTHKVYGAELQSRSLQISDSGAGVHGVHYKVSFDLITTGLLGSISIQFCSNSTFIDDPCTAPFGLDALNANLDSQSGVSGFTLSGSSTVNDLILSRLPTVTTAVPVTLEFSNIVNPTNNGSYYVRVQTFANSNASGVPTDSGGMAFVILGGITVGVSTEVPPYLTFCVAQFIPTLNCSNTSGDYIDLGNLGAGHTSSGTTQMLTATNATNGYSIYVNGDTLSSGNNIIDALSSNGISEAGVNQFGINLRANSSPIVGADPTGPGSGAGTSGYSQVNSYRYDNGEAVATSPVADDFRKYTVSYIVNVTNNDPPGVYASTFTYICLANF